MGIFLNLSGIALREVVGGALQHVGLRSAGDAVVGFLTERFTDHSQRLEKALQSANERAWKALEVALGGESLWKRCTGALGQAEDRALSDQVREFLNASYLTKASAQHAETFRQALKELREARSRGLLTGGRLAPDQLAREAGTFARFVDQQALVDAEWKVVDRAADDLRESCPHLCRLLVVRTTTGRSPSILAVAVRYYFRREVESDQALAQGLAFAKWEALKDAQEKGFAALTEALSRQGDRLEQTLADLSGVIGVIAVRTEEIAQTTQDTLVQVQALPGQFKKDLEHAVEELVERLQLPKREVRPSDSMSVRDEGERQLVRQLVAKYRSLPDAERERLPGLLSNLGKLELAAGDFGEAQQKFQTVAKMESDPKLKAEAHYNAYQAALQREEWPAALESIRQAMKLDAARFAPFPADYEPTKILGAGGFGVAFLCHHKFMDDDIVVKTLQTDELDGNVDRVFIEARALKRLDHPSIIRLSTCGFADADGKSRPYLAMDYFEGVNLESYVDVQGPLSPEDLLAIAVPVAEALRNPGEITSRFSRRYGIISGSRGGFS